MAFTTDYSLCECLESLRIESSSTEELKSLMERLKIKSEDVEMIPNQVVNFEQKLDDGVFDFVAIKAEIKALSLGELEVTEMDDIDDIEEIKIDDDFLINRYRRNNTRLSSSHDADACSVWIGNVDYGATNEGLKNHFRGCGVVRRVTILRDENTGSSKGYAYVEFADIEAARAALTVDKTFCGRKLKIACKRTNRPGISSTVRAPRICNIRTSNRMKVLLNNNCPAFKSRSWSRKCL